MIGREKKTITHRGFPKRDRSLDERGEKEGEFGRRQDEGNPKEGKTTNI